MEEVLTQPVVENEIDNDEVSTDANFEQIGCEKVDSLYWGGQLLKPEYQLYRLSTGKGRVYFRFQDQQNFRDPILYGGATSLSSEIPLSEEIINWKLAKGEMGSDRYMWMRTLFGSLSHTCIADYVNNGAINLTEIPRRVVKYFNDNHFYLTKKEEKELGTELQKDMISFRRWVQDYEVEFIAIEFPVWSDTENIASQVDILCFMNYSEGKGKAKTTRRVFSIIDYKSTKKGQNKDMRYQLHSYKLLMEEMFPELAQNEIKLFNLMGKNWRSTNWNSRSKPYLFSEQTDKVDLDRYSHYHALAQITRGEKIRRTVSFISGEMALNADPLEFIKTKSITEIISDGSWQGLMGSEEVEPIEVS